MQRGTRAAVAGIYYDYRYDYVVRCTMMYYVCDDVCLCMLLYVDYVDVDYVLIGIMDYGVFKISI